MRLPPRRLPTQTVCTGLHSSSGWSSVRAMGDLQRLYGRPAYMGESDRPYRASPPLYRGSVKRPTHYVLRGRG
eukprot:6213716-Pleurochrysis_carterae.AAC.5